MNYYEFCEILNRHIFENEKRELITKIAEYPERFIGLFRPTKPNVKVLQFLLQSHEIKMGDALEEVIEKIIESCGFRILNKDIINNDNEMLKLDQYFTDGRKYYFIEQKVRDDHDSTKKRGQIKNFEAKLEVLYRRHGSDIVGIIYFIDPNLSKNKAYYSNELEKLKEKYKLELYLLYGEELFTFLGHSYYWSSILSWLRSWKENLPDLPEVNFDKNPEESFQEIKDLDLKIWRKVVKNDELWDGGLLKVIFPTGETLIKVVNHLKKQDEDIANKLFDKVRKHYPNLSQDFSS